MRADSSGALDPAVCTGVTDWQSSVPSIVIGGDWVCVATNSGPYAVLGAESPAGPYDEYKVAVSS